jgi:hypothetical protein
MKQKKFSVFQLEFEGRKRQEMASITGISEHTLNIYMAKNGKWRPEYEIWTKEVLGDIEKETRLRIMKRVREALTVQEILLTMIKTNPGEAGRAARDILDRAGLITPKSGKALESPDDKAEAITKFFENRAANNFKDESI